MRNPLEPHHPIYILLGAKALKHPPASYDFQSNLLRSVSSSSFPFVVNPWDILADSAIESTANKTNAHIKTIVCNLSVYLLFCLQTTTKQEIEDGHK
jgi:hypothetical protein